MRTSIKIGTLILACTTLPAWAQIAPQQSSTTSSQAGKFNKTETVRSSVLVTGIDKASRTLSLKNPLGQIFDVVASDEVRNFNQIAVGDTVNVEYRKSLSLELTKADLSTEPGAAAVTARAQPGEKPAGLVGSAISVIAEVTDVNPEEKTITLQGPKGNLVTLDVKNPDHFRVVKKGDRVQATYSEAVAVSVEPIAKPTKKSS